MKQRNRWSKLAGVVTSIAGCGLLFFVLAAASCTARPYVNACPPGTNPSQGVCVEGGVIISFSQTGASSVSANSLAVTRESDPDLVGYAGGSATATVTVTLHDGTRRYYSTGLLYSSSKSASIAPRTPGNQVFAFIPSNPSSLQAFIDQYRSQAKDVALDTTVYLEDRAGTLDSTPVEVQETHDGSLGYLGTVSVSVGDINEEHKDV